MIDSVLNLLFRCPHRRLTRPVTPDGDTYVACLDCGKQFSYDLKEMRIGKPLTTGMTKSRGSKLKLAIMAVLLPVGMAFGSMLTSRRRRARQGSGANSKRTD
jgi:hypothetical protein